MYDYLNEYYYVVFEKTTSKTFGRTSDESFAKQLCKENVGFEYKLISKEELIHNKNNPD